MANKSAEYNPEDRINPIIIHDNEKGLDYTLDFSREAVQFAEDRGFDVTDTQRFVSLWKPFFYYAFRMHHRNMSRSQTDALYDRLGGFSPEFMARLIDLYEQARLSNNIVEKTEDLGKNGNLSVEL